METENFQKLEEKIDFISLSSVGSNTPSQNFFNLAQKMLSPEEVEHIRNRPEHFEDIKIAPLLEILEEPHYTEEQSIVDFYGQGYNSNKNQQFLIELFQYENPGKFLKGAIGRNHLKETIYHEFKDTIEEAKNSLSPSEVFYDKIQQLSPEKKEQLNQFTQASEDYFIHGMSGTSPHYDLKDVKLSLLISLNGNYHTINTNLIEEFYEYANSLNDRSFSKSKSGLYYGDSFLREQSGIGNEPFIDKIRKEIQQDQEMDEYGFIFPEISDYLNSEKINVQDNEPENSGPGRQPRQ